MWGFVIGPDESNDEYLADVKEDYAVYDDPLARIIIETHQKLKALDPDYRISQIKLKFGDLRYYFSSNKTGETRDKMDEVVREAEIEFRDNQGLMR
jgi:hypothetical protein